MRYRVTVLIVLSFLLLFSTSCEKSSVNDGEQQSYLNSGQNTTTDMSNMETRDGVLVLPTPGAQIDKSKVDAMLEEANTSFSSIVSIESTEEELKERVKKLKQLLQNERVLDDKELQVAFHSMLGVLNRRLSEHSETKDHLDQAIAHADSAISMFEDQPEYKADLAGAYSVYSNAQMRKKEYEEALSLMKYLIEEYQEIGYGPYKNWFASNQVDMLYNLVRMDSLKTGKNREIVNYFSEIAEKYDNEVGISAQIALAGYYYEEGEQSKVRMLSESIKNRMSSLNNQAFKDDKLSRVKNYIAQMENRQAQPKAVAERDTLFYEIQPHMVDQARITEGQNTDSYRVHIRLKENYHSQYEQLTRDNIGNFLGIVYEGEVISSTLPTIQTGISGGNFSLLFEKEERAKKIMQQISS